MARPRRIPPNEGSKGRGTWGAHPLAPFLDEDPSIKGKQRPRGERGRVTRKILKQAKPGDIDNLAVAMERQAEEELTRQVIRGEHALSFTLMERFQMRQLVEDGLSKLEIAQRFSTSIPVVSKILSMKENLSKAREEEIARQFFAFSAMLSQILQGMSPEKIERAGFSQLSLAMGITFDKLLAARKALDGDAPDRHQHELLLGTYEDRHDLLRSVQEKLERLREDGRLKGLLPIEAEVVTPGGNGKETSQVVTLSPPPESPQLPLFVEKESS